VVLLVRLLCTPQNAYPVHAAGTLVVIKVHTISQTPSRPERGESSMIYDWSHDLVGLYDNGDGRI